MSNSNHSKKLMPLIRKALKNIKNNLQLKRHSSKIVSIIGTTRKRCMIFSRSISRLIYTKFRTLINRPRLNSNHCHDSYQNVSVIYIDELFQGKTLSAKPFETKENMVPSSSTSTITKSPQAIKTTLDVPNLRKRHANAESSMKHENGLFLGKGKAKSNETPDNPAAADRWKIPLLPLQFRGIDERAEEFIAKFRRDMKLQREQSILDFQEMLKRSV